MVYFANLLYRLLMIQAYPSTLGMTRRQEDSNSSSVLSRPMPSVRRLVQMLEEILSRWPLVLARATQVD